jgi:hypothetical protein
MGSWSPVADLDDVEKCAIALKYSDIDGKEGNGDSVINHLQTWKASQQKWALLTLGHIVCP